ncbi:MAG TPA: ATP-binding protein [Baekduia sp.]|uniref:sensor histidine kinase n=1 Tax=Baekduia sp. TaxID=2600305 RepID=UPI002D7702F3|nr:ATP-binding protein [Baekduia sp.]HET6508848.1 ATP-binding protein [Baekduia sp.]
MSGKAASERRSGLDGRRIDVISTGAGIAVVAILVLFAMQLHATQTNSRSRSVARFQERAEIVSALMQAVVASAGAPAENARQYGGARVDDATLDRTAARGHVAAAALLDAHGAVLAASSGLTDADRARLRGSSAVRAALGGAPVAFGDVADGPAAAPLVDLAAGFATPHGRRVLVEVAPISALSTFLNAYLARIPTRSGTAYVLDAHGRVVGARDPATAMGRTVPGRGLAAAAGGARDGGYAGGRHYVAAPVPGTTWRVVLTTSDTALFSSVTGWRKWLPWLILAALGLTALGFVAVLRRAMRAAAQLRAANDRLAESNAQLESANALLRHAAELARSNAELEQFASIASHDLQEPLRKVQTFAAQINATEADRLSEQGQDFLRRMSDAAGRMRALIDDLLAFSRVSTKGRPFAPVALDDVAAQALSDLEIAIAESDARVTVGALPEVEADAVQMRQLLLNLIGNALKFRREGVTPVVRVDAHVADGIAELTVADNGLGFDPRFATRIFRAFERLHGAGSYPGTGIGLALCRKIVERHHGTITADGAENEGATFTVRLPVRQPDDGAPAPTQLFPNDDHPEVPHALA